MHESISNLEVGTCYLRMIIHSDWDVGGVSGVGPYSKPGRAVVGQALLTQPTTSSSLQGHREGAPETDGQPQLIWRRQTVNSSEVTQLACSVIGQLAGIWPLIGRASSQLMWERVSGAASRDFNASSPPSGAPQGSKH